MSLESALGSLPPAHRQPIPPPAPSAAHGTAPAVHNAADTLRSAASLWALEQLFGDRHAVLELVSRYRTWFELASAPLSAVARTTGHHPVTIPPVRPAVPKLPTGCRMVGMFDAGFPLSSDTLAPTTLAQDDPHKPAGSAYVGPLVVYVFGRLPKRPGVAVIGGRHPSAEGHRVARRSAELALDEGAVPICIVTSGCGDAALDATVVRGGQAVAVIPSGADRFDATNRRLIDQIVTGRGAVISVSPPGSVSTDARLREASVTAVTLARAVVLADTGVTLDASSSGVATAFETGRYVIAMQRDDARLVGIESLGSLALTRTDGTGVFGHIPHVARRLAQGRPPADAVVSDGVELEQAIAFGCGRSTIAPPDPDADGWQLF